MKFETTQVLRLDLRQILTKFICSGTLLRKLDIKQLLEIPPNVKCVDTIYRVKYRFQESMTYTV